MVEENKALEGGSPGIAAAMAMGPDGDRANTYLDEQTRLTRIQIEQIEEENATRRHILKLERASVAMKVAFELAVAIIVTIIVVGLGGAIWSAANDNGLIVESFSVPPDLVGRGLTGDVIAAKLLDKLSSLQSQTVSNRAASSYANNWGSDIKLQIPDTGVSIGEFNRSLHAWLGHQTRITGEVYRTPTGIAVTARAGSDTSPTFTGTDADLDKLISQAAESVYRATQPYRYAVYLSNAGRNKEAEAAYLALIANGSLTDRAWACIGLENIYANNLDMQHVYAVLDQAVVLHPGFIMAYINRAGIEGQLQHDEASYIAMRKAIELLHGQRDPDMGEADWQSNALTSASSVAAALGDYQGQIAYNHQLETMSDIGGQVENARQNDIVAYGFLHDGGAVRAGYANLAPLQAPLARLQQEASYGLAEITLGHPQFMLAAQPRLDPILASLGRAGVSAQKRQFWPFIAQGLALQGNLKGAHTWIDRTPADCGQCLRMRGFIDAREHNWKGADYWYARAVGDAPSLPVPLSDWGQTLLERGDYDGAIAKVEAAHEKGPRFADPLEIWGEALLAKNMAGEALDKFEEANRYAPNWGRLHLKWGEALLSSGRKDEAKQQFAIAARLDLSAAEKGELARHG